jgi:uncharacterized phiE125 gp8 family phage protein
MAEAKAHTRTADFTDDDVMIEVYLRTAIEFVESETNLRLAPATVQFRMEGWPCHCCHDLDLPAAPVRDVESVKYLDANGAEQTIAADQWMWRRNTQGKGTVSFVRSYSWPTLLNERRDTVFVTFDAGFDVPGHTGTGDDPDLRLPYLARAAVLLLVGHWYENREETTVGALSNLAPGVKSLCDKLRVYR